MLKLRNSSFDSRLAFKWRLSASDKNIIDLPVINQEENQEGQEVEKVKTKAEEERINKKR